MFFFFYFLAKQCAANEFGCVKNHLVYKCIPDEWVCDGGKDCYENTDEINCHQSEGKLDWHLHTGARYILQITLKEMYIFKVRAIEKERNAPRTYLDNLSNSLSIIETCKSNFSCAGAVLRVFNAGATQIRGKLKQTLKSPRTELQFCYASSVV